MPDAHKKGTRLHGRVDAPADRVCEHPDCRATGDFRAPRHRPGSAFGPPEGPPQWRWFCLEHVREFNAGYNWFAGMSPEAIQEAQSPFPQWERATRPFAHVGTGSGHDDLRFVDSMGVLRWRYGTHAFDGAATPAGRALSQQARRALTTFGLEATTTLAAIKKRYKELVRRYHPDMNGGDRAHEGKLQDVIAAYTELKSAYA